MRTLGKNGCSSCCVSQEEQLLGHDFWIFRTPKCCWVSLGVFEHLPVLADKEFCLIVLKQCGTSSLQFDDLQCGWWILSGKIRRIFHNIPLHTICVEKYIICRENGWIWRHLTIGKYVEGSITHIKAALHKGYLLSAQGRRIWDSRTYFLPSG